MKFWDSSAIVPLALRQPATEEVHALLSQDAEVAVWWGTRVEVVSAVARAAREGRLSPRAVASIVEEVGDFWLRVFVVPPSARVLDRSVRLLTIHELRAADAMQLAAALVAVGDRPDGFPFVTFDRRLRDATEREGFIVLPAQTSSL